MIEFELILEIDGVKHGEKAKPRKIELVVAVAIVVAVAPDPTSLILKMRLLEDSAEVPYIIGDTPEKSAITARAPTLATPVPNT
jgi:hypothetical protein